VDDRSDIGTRDLDAATLKRLKPARLVAIDDGGNVTSIAISGNRNRWERTARTARAFFAQGARIEARDAKDNVLWVFEDETLDAQVPEGSGGKVSSDVAGLLTLMLRGQDHACERIIAIIKPTLDAHVEMHRTMADRLNAHEKMFSLTLRELYDATIAKAEADSKTMDGPSDGIVGAMLAKIVSTDMAPNGGK